MTVVTEGFKKDRHVRIIIKCPESNRICWN